MSGLELIFTGSALLGTALLLLSSVGSGLRVRVHVPFRLPHPHVRFLRVSRSDDATILPIILGFLAMFGIGGPFCAAPVGFGPPGPAPVAPRFGALRAGGGGRPVLPAPPGPGGGAPPAPGAPRPPR